MHHPAAIGAIPKLEKRWPKLTDVLYGLSKNPKYIHCCSSCVLFCCALWEKDALMKILHIYLKNKVPSSNGINPSQGPPSFTLILSDFINTLTYSAKIGG